MFAFCWLQKSHYRNLKNSLEIKFTEVAEMEEIDLEKEKYKNQCQILEDTKARIFNEFKQEFDKILKTTLTEKVKNERFSVTKTTLEVKKISFGFPLNLTIFEILEAKEQGKQIIFTEKNKPIETIINKLQTVKEEFQKYIERKTNDFSQTFLEILNSLEQGYLSNDSSERYTQLLQNYLKKSDNLNLELITQVAIQLTDNFKNVLRTKSALGKEKFKITTLTKKTIFEINHETLPTEGKIKELGTQLAEIFINIDKYAKKIQVAASSIESIVTVEELTNRAQLLNQFNLRQEINEILFLTPFQKTAGIQTLKTETKDKIWLAISEISFDTEDLLPIKNFVETATSLITQAQLRIKNRLELLAARETLRKYATIPTTIDQQTWDNLESRISGNVDSFNELYQKHRTVLLLNVNKTQTLEQLIIENTNTFTQDWTKRKETLSEQIKNAKEALDKAIELVKLPENNVPITQIQWNNFNKYLDDKENPFENLRQNSAYNDVLQLHVKDATTLSDLITKNKNEFKNAWEQKKNQLAEQFQQAQEKLKKLQERLQNDKSAITLEQWNDFETGKAFEQLRSTNDAVLQLEVENGKTFEKLITEKTNQFKETWEVRKNQLSQQLEKTNEDLDKLLNEELEKLKDNKPAITQKQWNDFESGKVFEELRNQNTAVIKLRPSSKNTLTLGALITEAKKKFTEAWQIKKTNLLEKQKNANTALAELRKLPHENDVINQNTWLKLENRIAKENNAFEKLQANPLYKDILQLNAKGNMTFNNLISEKKQEFKQVWEPRRNQLSEQLKKANEACANLLKTELEKLKDNQPAITQKHWNDFESGAAFEKLRADNKIVLQLAVENKTLDAFITEQKEQFKKAWDQKRNQLSKQLEQAKKEFSSETTFSSWKDFTNAFDSRKSLSNLKNTYKPVLKLKSNFNNKSEETLETWIESEVEKRDKMLMNHLFQKLKDSQKLQKNKDKPETEFLTDMFNYFEEHRQKEQHRADALVARYSNKSNKKAAAEEIQKAAKRPSYSDNVETQPTINDVYLAAKACTDIARAKKTHNDTLKNHNSPRLHNARIVFQAFTCIFILPIIGYCIYYGVTGRSILKSEGENMLSEGDKDSTSLVKEITGDNNDSFIQQIFKCGMN